MEMNPYKSPSADGSSPQAVPSLTLPVTFAYHVGPEDILRWCVFFYRNSPVGRRQRFRAIAMCTVLYLIAASIVGLPSRSWVVLFVAFGVAAIATLTTPRWFDRRIKKAMKRQLDTPLYAGRYGPHQLTLSDAGVRETTPTGELFVKWPFVNEASLDGDHIFIQMANGHAAVLERESFSGPIPFEDIIPIVNELARQAKQATRDSHGSATGRRVARPEVRRA